MAKLLKDEYSMVTFKTYKDGNREKTNTIISVLLNFLFRGVAGSGTKEFEFTLTNNNLYIDNIGYDMTGQLEVFVTEKINRKDINAFEVKKEGNKEIIKLLKNNGKAITYMRDNENSANLATEMATLIAQGAGN
jgi:antitoxin component of RelBE/YafQ-DinJ toxin-antitoxin module